MRTRACIMAGVVVWSAAGLLVSVPHGGAVAEYAVVDLGFLPGDDSAVPWGLSEAGAVVGWSTHSTDYHAFLWTEAGGMVELPCPFLRCIARDISDGGHIVGSGWGATIEMPGQAIRWTDGAPQLLGTLGTGSYSEAHGVNDAGAVVGYSYVDGGSYSPHAFLYSDADGMVDVTTGYGYDIDEAGTVAGAKSGWSAFRWTPGNLEVLGAAEFTHSYGNAINDAGQVGGCLRSATGNAERIARHTAGLGWENLGGGGETNCAWGINGYGDVVGLGRPGASGLVRAFLYTDADGLRDLRSLIENPLDWFLYEATDINDAGQIVVTAFSNVDTKWHALLLNPLAPTDRAPGRPTLLSATLEGTGVVVSWSLSSDDGGGANDVVGYEVWAGTAYDSGGAGYTLLATTAAGTTDYADAGAGLGDTTPRFYRVLAVDEGGHASPAFAQAGKFVRFFPAGHNLVSLPLVPEDATADAVFASVPWTRVATYVGGDDPWRMAGAGRPWSDLGRIDRVGAYWVVTGADAWWTLAGLVPSSTQVTLQPGWNLVGYPSLTPRLAAEVFAVVDYRSLQGYVPTPPYNLAPLAPTDEVAPGAGYWVRANAAAVLTVMN